ncbi:peptidase S8/S53 domain-containing protein [Podospora aff. communis PSN243]|uniref:Peptidase S8/S53 domain-containing protein n=1 Tax=Podospora aff. communis PSN243 TaxID=3040156 RepID=A0AAV9GI09_9PEZI|nr:peptidase S8/S53 domain-containing protein [Podospora aff. communis PSN243]
MTTDTLPPAKATHDGDDSSYMVFPITASDEARVNETEGFIFQTTGTWPTRYNENSKSTRLWFWVAQFNDTARDEILKHPGVGAMDENSLLDESSVLPHASLKQIPRATQELSYTTEENAARELVSISQPSTVPDLSKLSNYVFETGNGGRSFIYHFEFGVAVGDHPTEFKHVAANHIWTPLAEALGLDAYVDGSLMPFHGTCTADKALGSEQGVSKRATLVIVRLAQHSLAEMLAGLAEIIQDVQDKPERRKRSVVSMSISGPVFDITRITTGIVSALVEYMMGLDIPIVVTAGNQAETPGREQVDSIPAVFAGQNNPIIVVGSTNTDGEVSRFSQVGSQVTLYAVGEGIACHGNPTLWQGTSFSSAMVAGEVANLLSYDTVPFDTSDGNLVKNLRDYLVSDASSWERKPGIRMLWNGITEANNPPIQSQGPHKLATRSSNDERACYGLGNNTYVNRDLLYSWITTDFCAKSEKKDYFDGNSGWKSARYAIGTMEDVIIGIQFRGAQWFAIPSEECTNRMMDLVDNCDMQNPSSNPANYKAGGYYVTSKNGQVITFDIWPMATRQPAEDGIRGGCNCTYDEVAGTTNFEVWGHGFETDDFGYRTWRWLLDNTDNFLTSTWYFQYGGFFGTNGREFTMRFNMAGKPKNRLVKGIIEDAATNSQLALTCEDCPDLNPHR